MSTSSGLAALGHVAGSAPDMVLPGLGLSGPPGLSGYEALRMLRAVSSVLVLVLVLVIAAQDEEAETIRVLDAGST